MTCPQNLDLDIHWPFWWCLVVLILAIFCFFLSLLLQCTVMFHLIIFFKMIILDISDAYLWSHYLYFIFPQPVCLVLSWCQCFVPIHAFTLISVSLSLRHASCHACLCFARYLDSELTLCLRYTLGGTCYSDNSTAIQGDTSWSFLRGQSQAKVMWLLCWPMSMGWWPQTPCHLGETEFWTSSTLFA